MVNGTTDYCHGMRMSKYNCSSYFCLTPKTMTPSEEAARTWLDEQKRRLKEGLYPAVLQAIAPYQEDTQIADEYAPVRVCHRSLSSRFDQLHYDQALRQNLPIGSGEIESAHRYLVQQRLKRPGTWWRTDNAEYILALRTNRANCRWRQYWGNTASAKSKETSA